MTIMFTTLSQAEHTNRLLMILAFFYCPNCLSLSGDDDKGQQSEVAVYLSVVVHQNQQAVSCLVSPKLTIPAPLICPFN